jgi:hypothetical protein
MSLTPSDIARIANLARLELQPAESARMLTQINGFFGLVETMRSVDTLLSPLPLPQGVRRPSSSSRTASFCAANWSQEYPSARPPAA